MRIEPLGISNPHFYAFKQIELASSGMMIRELTQNAIEAALKAPKKNRKIVFSKEIHYGVPKLCIWNTGIGLDSDEIWQMAQIGCNINKEQGLDKNFGEGAKVSALRHNPLGMIYTSCKKGVVSRIWLTRGNDCYGFVTFEDDDRATLYNDAVLDVTDEYSDEKRAFDWTQVVLLGQNESQNTVVDPYGEGKQTTFWLAEEIYNRFYRINPSIEVRLEVGHRYAKERSSVVFETLEHRRSRPVSTKHGVLTGVFTRSETVVENDGIKYHFIHDEADGSQHISVRRNCLQSDSSLGGIIFKNEIYSLHKGSDWTSNAFKYGINFGGKFISVLIELPDNYPALPETNRRHLQDLERTTLTLERFAEQINNNRPQWIKDLVEQYNTSREFDTGDLQKRLRALMDELLRQESNLLATTAEPTAKPDDNGKDIASIVLNIEGEGGGGGGGGDNTTTPRKKNLLPGANDENTRRKSRYPMFAVEPLTTEEELKEKNIEDKAGLFSRTGNGTAFINMLYPVVEKTFNRIVEHFPRYRGDEMFENHVRETVREHLGWRVCSTIVRALAKHRNHPNWSREDIDRALSPESLSMAADDFTPAEFGVIKSKIAMRFANEKVAA